MRLIAVLLVLLPLEMVLLADDTTDRVKLLGSWVLRKGGGSADAWIIDGAASGLHLIQTEDAKTIADFECTIGGRDCDVRIGGHKATVSMYYNGAALVELETRGDKVIKRRFSILPSGNSMKLEVIPVTGNDASREFQFQRAQPQEGKK